MGYVFPSNRLSQAFSLFAFLYCSQPSHATMQSLTDQELDETLGQAFINLDQYDQDGLSYTRLNMGLDIKIQMNADEVVFGEYPRAGETNSADIDFRDFALGYIRDGELVPFEMRDPFIEWAYDRSGGTNEFAGMRFGFGEARGMMSFKAMSFTGNVDVVIDGQYTLDLLGGLIQVPLNARGQTALVDTNGNLDPIRATHIGIPNGESFEVDVLPGLSIDVGVNNCVLELVNDTMCFPLTNYESMQIGQPTGNGDYDFSDGLFVSFQSQPVRWGKAASGERQVDTVQGAFFNIPRGSVELTPDEARTGTPRVATEFIDRGVGRFLDPRYLDGTLPPYP